MNKVENNPMTTTDFWKGLMLGTMTGMVIAAYTYGIADRSQKQIKYKLEGKPGSSPMIA
jgi:hypothetical protein